MNEKNCIKWNITSAWRWFVPSSKWHGTVLHSWFNLILTFSLLKRQPMKGNLLCQSKHVYFNSLVDSTFLTKLNWIKVNCIRVCFFVTAQQKTQKMIAWLQLRNCLAHFKVLSMQNVLTENFSCWGIWSMKM